MRYGRIVLSKDSIEVEVANDAIYIHIDKDAHNQINENSPTTPLSPSAPPSPSSIAKSLHRKMSLTSQSLNNLAATSPSHFAVTLSTSIEKPFKIFIETINFASEVRDLLSLKLGFQIGLFHGGKPLEPLKTIFLHPTFHFC